MDFHGYLLIFFSFLILILCLLVAYRSQYKSSLVPTNWPVLGMIPAALVNSHRLHDYATDIVTHNGGTFLFKGPWLANMDMFLTTNPLDIHHILSKNFQNYPKGHKFRKIFSILGDSISNTDGTLWEFHRKTLMSLFKHPYFQTLLEKITWKKVEERLLPMLESISRQGAKIDLQEVFQRFTFDTSCELFFDHDPQSLSLEFPYIPCEKALSDMEEALLGRHLMPPIFWKLQQLLNIGNEKKLNDAWKTFDQFIYKFLSKEEKESSNINSQPTEENFKILPVLRRDYKSHNHTSGDPNKILRDTLLNLMAGRDSTGSALTWLFYLLAKNPLVQDKIHEELHTQLGMQVDGKWKDFNVKEMGKLIYLHGAVSEALRLFPSIPINHKIPLQPDILPSGHHVDHNTTIILPYYTMGRMKSIWGEDCMEFKPERWISMEGVIKHQPFYMFPVFNAGPRTCVAKHMVLCQVKIVAATILNRYLVELVDGHVVFPSDSIILHMKNGLKVKLAKRSEMDSKL